MKGALNVFNHLKNKNATLGSRKKINDNERLTPGALLFEYSIKMNKTFSQSFEELILLLCNKNDKIATNHVATFDIVLSHLS